MALKNPVQFENEIDGDTLVIDRPAATPEAAQEKAAPLATASRALVAPPSSAVAALRQQIEAKKGAGDFSFGMNKIFKAMQGGEIEENNRQGVSTSLGRWVKVYLKAWDFNHKIVPGFDGGESANFLAFSRDGKTIDKVVGEEYQQFVGRPVQEYLDFLRNDQELTKAQMKQEIDAICMVLDSEKSKDLKEMIQITFNSSSVVEFKKYQAALENTVEAVENNLPGYSLPEQPFIFYVLYQKRKNATRQWYGLTLCKELPANT